MEVAIMTASGVCKIFLNLLLKLYAIEALYLRFSKNEVPCESYLFSRYFIVRSAAQGREFEKKKTKILQSTFKIFKNCICPLETNMNISFKI